jgi:hypothetical protein
MPKYNLIEHLNNFPGSYPNILRYYNLSTDVNIPLTSNPHDINSNILVNNPTDIEFSIYGAKLNRQSGSTGRSNIIIPAKEYDINYTISFYIFPNEITNNTPLVSQGDPNGVAGINLGGLGWLLRLYREDNGDGKLHLFAGDSHNNNGKDGITLDSPIKANEWNHICIIFSSHLDGSNTSVRDANIYINGNSNVVNLDIHDNINLPGSFVIFDSPFLETENDNTFDGYIQNFSVFPINLSESNISDLVSITTTLFEPSSYPPSTTTNPLLSYPLSQEPPHAPALSHEQSVAQTNLINSIQRLIFSSNFFSNNDFLNAFSDITKDQLVSTTVVLPDPLKNTFSNKTTYPLIADIIAKDPTIPMFMASTAKNASGIESVDITQIPDNSDPTKPVLLIIPSLELGKTVEIGGVTVLRGNGADGYTQGTNGGTSLELSVDGGNWIHIGAPIIIGNKIFELTGIGSPVIFTITNRTNDKPVTIFDYLFMYSYFFATLGAIFFSISSFISIDAASILVNKNISILLNTYIAACGFISLCVWFNLSVSNIISYDLFNQNVVLTRI